MTVGFFSPLPPARTGVADYSACLLAAMREGGQVELAPSRSTISLYHLGNNQLHADIYALALREPGVIVLHDAVLHHFLLGQLTREQYLAEFTYNYGDWSRQLAIELWDQRRTSASDERYFEYPMLRRICEASRAVVVHNPKAAQMVRQHVPDSKVFEIPHLVFPHADPPLADVLRARERLDLGPRELLCGLFGHLRESKRVRSVVEACGRAGLRLLISGPCPQDLRRAMEPWFRQPWVIRRDYTSEEEFHLLHHAVDLCANLRYPFAGETSGISVRLMAAAKAVIVTRSGENSRYPVDTCIPIEHGLAELDHLTCVLEWLRRFPAHAGEIGRRASAYIRFEHSPVRVAGLYWSVLRAFM